MRQMEFELRTGWWVTKVHTTAVRKHMWTETEIELYIVEIGEVNLTKWNTKGCGVCCRGTNTRTELASVEHRFSRRGRTRTRERQRKMRISTANQMVAASRPKDHPSIAGDEDLQRTAMTWSCRSRTSLSSLPWRTGLVSRGTETPQELGVREAERTAVSPRSRGCGRRGQRRAGAAGFRRRTERKK
jgi:hypothetical protein